MTHTLERVRHELKRRAVTVRSVEQVTPAMVRITLEGEDLADFVSLGADDHIKVFVPGSGEMRDYTPRRYDNADRSLVIDFAMHGGQDHAGPATAWARDARPGDEIRIGGPKGSMVVSPTFDWYLLIGDETALPAIGRRLEELPAGAKVITVAAVTGPEEEQTFTTAADHTAIWIHRPESANDDPAPVMAVLETLSVPEGDGFVWIGTEARVMRAAKAHVIDTMKHNTSWLKASGYWIKGQADSSEK
ncbi:siderophore-interacting protein [Novosphingobium sp. 9]|uniref:siderophore-interacting protein n=1 Tax=Novosphingobium sp. 9 TaxID=2025349 RepID=UPI0021B5847B|nr:siderophore-interacting protein [Novosphingobium sp. 9]